MNAPHPRYPVSIPFLFALGTILIIASLFAANLLSSGKAAAQGAARFAGPTKSSPLALSADDSLLAVANPDANTVSLFDVGADRNVPLGEFAVGREPNGVAISPDGEHLFAATEVGPFRYDRASASWQDIAGIHAPDAIYWHVDYVPDLRIARFSTFGRGLWDYRIDGVDIVFRDGFDG